MPTNPRQSCVQALLEWEKGKYFSDEILHTAGKEPALATRPAFFMETFFGVLRNLSRLDFLIARLREGKVDPRARAVLRLGLYHLSHAHGGARGGNESVALGGRARGLINAILRRALREKEALDSALAAAGPAIRTSHPEFLIERWGVGLRPGSHATALRVEQHTRRGCMCAPMSCA